MNEKDIYRKYCQQDGSLPLYLQDWWLDAVAGADGWAAAILQENDRVIAVMPYAIKRKYGFTVISQPPLTQFLGPWFEKPQGKPPKRQAREAELLRALISRLPKFDSFSSCWHSSQTNWLPFYWAGFRQTTRYTYVINKLSGMSEIVENFTSSYRNKIKNAARLVTTGVNLPIETFYELNAKTFGRQGVSIPYELEFLRRLDNALIARCARRIFYAKGADGALHSALYLAWDDSSAYVLMIGEDPKYRSSGAGILLIYDALKFAFEELSVVRFDFAGSMMENVEKVRRDCGAIRTPYFSVYMKPSLIYGAVVKIKASFEIFMRFLRNGKIRKM